MTPNVREPLSTDSLFKGFKAKLEAFEKAFRKGPVNAQQTVEIWEKALDVRLECERFYQFVLDYWSIVNGVLWAHYPEEYREKIYPHVRELTSKSPLTETIPFTSLGHRPRTLLDIAEEIFLSRDNEPLSISQLVLQMRKVGTQFKAKEPAKSLAQTMRNSGRFEIVGRGVYRLKEAGENSSR